MRRIKRTKNIEINLTIHNEDYINPPRPEQRNALINQLLKETLMNADALNKLASSFVSGATNLDMSDRTHVDLEDDDIMENWQIPLMQKMANIVTEDHGDVLEIGFGKGVSSDMIQAGGVQSHTIIECNESVIERFHQWKTKYLNARIEMVPGLWQDTIQALGLYDAIFFHTYPLNEEEYLEYVHNSSTFAEHFFESAAKHLKQGGVFTYMTNEIDSLSRAHQRALLKHFSSYSASLVTLNMPNDVRDTWWSNSMVVVKAIK